MSDNEEWTVVDRRRRGFRNGRGDVHNREQMLKAEISRRTKLSIVDPRRKGCQHCGGDHLVSNCPCDVTTHKNRPLPSKPRCFKCHKLGHDSASCPRRHPNSFLPGKRCWNCGEIGHFDNKCPHPQYEGN
ncbi:hypothetical protein Mgra_00004139 [Meloidogyne graminicola]|uniref:CCHC-type domain-containing protein n=1 Tax=Meloidogyne graminicola TaxID=189291 RepID=A0A8S9ZS99_9BILA|nr:hypothetical protein Mgra_00004139 [Meloidogyne graminicola]